ncbi:STAS-like domain-containing protein [Prevotella sp. HUN102]|uniref:STAS-like domain-containing protein n=1 Tax=Prevotella sp. HUN102 TaxID=1392486 RepID=UPI00048D9B7A|nr:DUF4325 domain-containing protein [Prevotella sp. HUN102]
MCTININEVLNTKGNLPDAGKVLYEMLIKAINKGEKVTANMEEVSSLPSIFLNVSLGKIIDEYGIETLKKHIQFVKITKSQALRLKDYLERYN